MPTYNYDEGWVFLADGINSDAEYDDTSAVVAADLTYIGVKEAGSGWMVEKSEEKRDSTGTNITMKYELTIELNVLTELASATKTALDGEVVALVYIPASGVTVDRDAETFTLGTGSDGILLLPTELTVVEDYKLGQDEVQPIKITGSIKRQTKAELSKTVSYSAT